LLWRLNNATDVQVTDAPSVTMDVHIDIEGMHCASCSNAIELALASEPGVTSASVNLLQNCARVTYDTSQTSPSKLAEVIESCGFTATPQAPSSASIHTINVEITGMHCASCSTAVETALRAVPGVTFAEVNLLLSSATIHFSASMTGPRSILQAIESAGFQAELAPDPTAGGAVFAVNAAAASASAAALQAALLFSLPVLVIGKIGPLIPGISEALEARILGFQLGELLKWILTTPVMFVMGWRFHAGAWAALKRGTANMDVLVSLGTNAAYFYSVTALLCNRFVPDGSWAGAGSRRQRPRIFPFCLLLP
jgi:P-type Cu+ transporter